ncbi:hypothetical protein BLOT_007469 [Blomia tropicalis]|nr:hypothetical protein BLOT_007469 [Blomia tropicalis]
MNNDTIDVIQCLLSCPMTDSFECESTLQIFMIRFPNDNNYHHDPQDTWSVALVLTGLCHIRDWQCGQISWNSRSESIQPNRQQQQQMLSAFMMTTGMVVLFSLIE